MSCQIRTTAIITDVPTIRRVLFPTDDLRGSDSWLQLCKISISPTGETIVITNEKRIVVLVSKWNSRTSQNEFDILYSGSLESEDPIKAVLCLPVVIQSSSSQVGPEWTCIAVGFQSGYVKFYTEDCKYLFGEQFHNESVSSLKCHSQHSPRPDINLELKLEEIYVQYPSNVCSINGSHLFGILRNCRNYLLRGINKLESTDSTLTGSNLKKWGFSEQFQVNDVGMVGLDLSNTFDHLLTASTCGGFDTKYRTMAPHNSLVVSAGSKPFVAFHYALEGGNQPVLTDVAKAVAIKLKSALPGWLTGHKASMDKPITLASQASEPMGCRFGICDLRRTAASIILSQDRRLATVTDFLGRVMLIDTHRGVAVRMFKGYRDAQCAFMQVPHEKRSKHRCNTKVATFLIVYCPKKGTLEIFTAQQGSKIATFSASKFSTLLYIDYGLMGFQVTSKSRYVCSFTCILIDPDGQLKEIIVPFHFALTEKNSKRTRDLHLYKRLKQSVKTEQNFADEALNTCMEIKTSEVQLQCLQMLMSCKDINPDIMLRCTEYFMEKYQSLEEEELNADIKTLKNLSETVNSLSQFYVFLITDSHLDLDIENGNKHAEEVDTKLNLNEKMINNLQRLLDLSTLDNNKKSPEMKVSFLDSKLFNYSSFLLSFNLTNGVYLKPNLEPYDLFKVSEIIFESYINNERTDFQQFKNEVERCQVLTKDLFKMVLCYWVNRPLNINSNLEKEMQNLSQLVYILSRLDTINNMIVEYNEISPFWMEIRAILADSSKPFPALTAALICRCVAQRIEHEKELQQSGTSIEDENIEIWEKLSQENCEWMLLIGKLEDVSLLNIILSNKPYLIDSKYCILPRLKHNPVDISLKYVLEKGKGTVSELVAQWLTTAGVEPESIVLNDMLQQDNEQISSDPSGSSNVEHKQKGEPLFEHLNIIKKQFPYSLNSSVLLANMCWEYALAWQRQVQEFAHLDAAIKCLNSILLPHIKQGMYNLVWNTHLKIIFESTCKLINKVGKLPKERLCKQDTGLTDFQITLFIGTCTTFLDDFLEVVQQSYNSEKVRLSYEGIWDNGGGQPLAKLALQQNHINYDLLHAHYQLSLTIQMITTFTGIKHTKPVNTLFDSSVIGLFFTDLQQKTQTNWHGSDTRMHASRTQFLLKVISASIETVSVTDGKVYSADHVKWMSRCVSLARVWNLDADLLKRFQILQLFLNGFDDIGEELLPSLTEVKQLGPDLLMIAGKRLSQYLMSCADLAENIAALTPLLTKYLDSLNGEWCAPSSLESILNMGTHCLRCLEENQPEYKIACQLLEACSTLQNIRR